MRTTPVFVCTLLACSLAGQNVLLPDNHHLMESSSQAYLIGSTNWWGTTTTGRRFQVCYEASHFTGKAGVSSPVVITHLRFRGDDTRKNTGGQTYTNVTVNVLKTSTPAASLSTTFATNLPASLGGTSATTTLLGSAVIPLVTVAPSLGTSPNNYMIELDLSAAGILPFDPLGDALGEVNLLVDIRWTGYANGPAIAPATTTITMLGTQDTTTHGAGIRGRGVYGTTPTSTTGTGSSNPPIMNVEFLGGGGWAVPPVATTESIGFSCGGAASAFYQLLPHGQPFDMSFGGLTMTPDNAASPNYYVVTGGAPAFDATMVNALPNTLVSGTSDDGVVNHALGFTFAFPGGSTSVIRPSTNGFIWLNGVDTDNDFSPTLLEFLGNTNATPKGARFAPFWHDFDGGDNATTHPNCGLHALTDTSGGAGNAVCYVTWLNTSEFNAIAGGGQSVNSMQCVFYEATGVVEFRYGAINVSGSTFSTVNLNGIIGFTRGNIAGVNSVDPQSRDLSIEVPFATSVEGGSGNAQLTASSAPLAAGAAYGARMFGGQSVTFGVNNIPTGTLLAILSLDIAATQPGFGFPGITGPGCGISTSLNPVFINYETWVLPGSSVVGVTPLVVPHGWEGVGIVAQAHGLDIFGGPTLLPWSTNGVRYLVGLD